MMIHTPPRIATPNRLFMMVGFIKTKRLSSKMKAAKAKPPMARVEKIKRPEICLYFRIIAFQKMKGGKENKQWTEIDPKG